MRACVRARACMRVCQSIGRHHSGRTTVRLARLLRRTNLCVPVPRMRVRARARARAFVRTHAGSRVRVPSQCRLHIWCSTEPHPVHDKQRRMCRVRLDSGPKDDPTWRAAPHKARSAQRAVARPPPQQVHGKTHLCERVRARACTNIYTGMGLKKAVIGALAILTKVAPPSQYCRRRSASVAACMHAYMCARVRMCLRVSACACVRACVRARALVCA